MPTRPPLSLRSCLSRDFWARSAFRLTGAELPRTLLPRTRVHKGCLLLRVSETQLRIKPSWVDVRYGAPAEKDEPARHSGCRGANHLLLCGACLDRPYRDALRLRSDEHAAGIIGRNPSDGACDPRPCVVGLHLGRTARHDQDHQARARDHYRRTILAGRADRCRAAYTIGHRPNRASYRRKRVSKTARRIGGYGGSGSRPDARPLVRPPHASFRAGDSKEFMSSVRPPFPVEILGNRIRRRTGATMRTPPTRRILRSSARSEVQRLVTNSRNVCIHHPPNWGEVGGSGGHRWDRAEKPAGIVTTNFAEFSFHALG